MDKCTSNTSTARTSSILCCPVPIVFPSITHFHFQELISKSETQLSLPNNIHFRCAFFKRTTTESFFKLTIHWVYGFLGFLLITIRFSGKTLDLIQFYYFLFGFLEILGFFMWILEMEKRWESFEI